MLRRNTPGPHNRGPGSSQTAQAAGWAEWPTFFPAARPMKVPPGTVLVEAHEATDAVVFLLSGLVHLLCRSRDGRDRVVGWRESDAILGGVAALAGRRYAASAVTLVESTVLKVSVRVFLETIEQNLDFNRRVHAVHAVEIWDQISRSCDLACLPASARLAKFLLRLVPPADRTSNARSVTVRCPVALIEMAAVIGVDSKTLHRTLASLREASVIERGLNERVFTFVPAKLSSAVNLDDPEVT